MLSDYLKIYGGLPPTQNSAKAQCQCKKIHLASLEERNAIIIFIRCCVCCFFNQLLILIFSFGPCFSFFLLHTITGLRLWHCHHSLGRCQVQFVAAPKASNASQVEETAARDGEEDAH